MLTTVDFLSTTLKPPPAYSRWSFSFFLVLTPRLAPAQEGQPEGGSAACSELKQSVLTKALKGQFDDAEAAVSASLAKAIAESERRCTGLALADLAGGKEIFVSEGPDPSYRRIHSTPAGNKAQGLSQLLRYWGDKVAVLALYGDRFDDPDNDGNAVGNEAIPLIINVGADQHIALATTEQVFLNPVEKGPATTWRHIALITERLRARSKEAISGCSLVLATVPILPTRAWRFEVPDTGAERPDTVEVHGPGFVWSWNPQGLCWLTPLLPNVASPASAARPLYRARLPGGATAFTFFWTGGEETQTGHAPGHWEGQDFVVAA